MKRKIILFLALILVAVIPLGGCSCSCSSATVLEFTSAFNGGNKPNVNYHEEITYKVEYQTSYGDYFRKSETVTDDVIKYELTSGTYKMTLDVMDKIQIPQDKLTDDMANNLETSSISHVYRLKTELNLNVHYSSDRITEEHPQGKAKERYEKDFNDVITTESYFLGEEHAFAPIYSETKSDTSLVSITSDDVSVAKLDYTYITKYTKGGYEIVKTISNNEPGYENYGYGYKTAIDNNVLLFALRNFSLEVGESKALNVIHPVYGTPQALAIKNLQELKMNINLNGNAEELSVKEFSFIRSEVNATGFPQYVKIQSGTTQSLKENKSYLVQYAEPLICWGSFSCMGALIFTISSIN